jgi:LacI family transcriptional regulator
MSITLKDVAVRARVSLATVSKVLNNRYDVAPETVEIVESAIRQVGYERSATRRGRPTSSSHPPSARRSQHSNPQHSGSQRTHGIALLIPATKIELMQSTLTGQLVHGVEAVVRERGIHFFLTRFADDGSLPPCLDPLQVDGLIVRNSTQVITVPLPMVPTVWIFKSGFAPTPGDLIQPDNEIIGEMAARYLLERGHQHLAVVTARLGHVEAQVRADRFTRFARGTGAAVLALECKPDMEAIADRLLSQEPRVTGLFMPLGDHLVEGVYRALQQRAISCGGAGRDINLISCNNDATHLRLLDPSLPNIDIRADVIGHEAAQTLLWRIQNPHQHRRCILIEPQLVQSSMPKGLPQIESD